VVKDFYTRLIDFRCMKQKMAALNAKVRLLTKVCRRFVVKKNQWCDQASKHWIQFEDHHLSRYFKEYEQRILDETSEEPAKSSSKTKINPGSAPMTDWKKFRIPVAERRFALGRWYLLKLRRKVQNMKGWTELLDVISERRREVQHFLALCGFDDASEHRATAEHLDPAANEPVVPSSPGGAAVSARITEQEALELIALSAQELRDTPPFQDHPSNKDAPAVQEGLTSGKMRRMLMRNEEGTSGGQQQNKSASGWLGRVRGKAPSIDSAEVGEEEGGKVRPEGRGGQAEVDVDELFRRFTPRLRHLWQEPTVPQVPAVTIQANLPPRQQPAVERAPAAGEVSWSASHRGSIPRPASFDTGGM